MTKTRQRFLFLGRTALLAAVVALGASSTAPAASLDPNDSVIARYCTLDELSPAQLDGYGRSLAGQLLGDTRARAAMPDQTPISASINACGWGRNATADELKQLNRAISNRLALRWSALELARLTQLPTRLVELTWKELTEAEQAGIDDQGIDEATGTKIDTKMQRLLGRELSEREVDLFGLALKLRKIAPRSSAESIMNQLPFEKNGMIGCALDSPSGGPSACARKWGWSTVQQVRAAAFVQADVDLKRAVTAMLAKAKIDGALESKLFSCGLMGAQDELVGGFTDVLGPAARRSIVSARGGPVADSVALAAFGRTCYDRLPAWSQSSATRGLVRPVVLAMAQRDQAEVDFYQAQPGL